MYNNNQFISFKMVSQCHTITNNSPETIGPVAGSSGYYPSFTLIKVNTGTWLFVIQVMVIQQGCHVG